MNTPFMNMDPLATVRTEQHNVPNTINLLPTLDLNKDSKQLSQHERKEAEIYQTIANMPNRRIHFMEQKTEE